MTVSQTVSDRKGGRRDEAGNRIRYDRQRAENAGKWRFDLLLQTETVVPRTAPVQRPAALKKTEIETYEVLILGGRDYERLIGQHDKPLPEREARQEQRKMDRELARRDHESAADKAKREKERQEERRFLNEVPEAFTFHLVGEETVSGKPAWVITAYPRADYQPKDRRARLITKLRGKVWIDKGEYQWVKVDAEAIGALSFGLGLVRIEPEAIVHFEQTRINDEVWLPAIARIYADARLALFRQVHSEVDMVFRDYRKFQTDSHLVTEESH